MLLLERVLEAADDVVGKLADDLEHVLRKHLDGRREDCLQDGGVQDGVAHPHQGDHQVLAKEAGDVRRDFLPEVGEEMRNLEFVQNKRVYVQNILVCNF